MFYGIENDNVWENVDIRDFELKSYLEEVVFICEGVLGKY